MFFKRFMCFMFGILFLPILSVLLIMSAGGNPDKLFQGAQWPYFLASSLYIGIAWYGLVRMKIDSLSRPTLRQFFGFLLFLVLALLFKEGISRLAGDGMGDSQSAREITTFMKHITPAMIAQSTLFGPIIEETFHRGYMQKGAFENSWLGIIITSTFFSSFHGPDDIWRFLVYFGLGVILGVSYKRYDNIFVPIGVHIALNAIPMIAYFVLNVS